MTRENAKLLLPIIEAYANGETVQGKCDMADDGWIDLEQPAFEGALGYYRIKPKPREWWIVDNGGPLEIYVHKPWGNPPVKEIIHVIEAP